MPRLKSDPLLAALIKKLPAPGADWPVDRQLAWLRLMAMAMGAVYGGDAAVQFIKEQPAQPPKLTTIEHAFYIDKNGYARKAGGKRVLPTDVKNEIVDLRGIDGDVTAITWADDTTGVARAGHFLISAA